MDVFEFINNNGTRKIANPNYNAKSKKNGEPRTIEVPDLGYDEDPRVNLAIQDFTNQSSTSVKDIEKYSNAGVNWNNWENLDKQLADSQSATAKWFNGLSQAVVSEIGLGTLKGFTDLFDFVISKVLHLTEDDYQNAASTKIQEWQDAFNNNIAPIYRDETLNIQNGGFGDAGWWASNLPSVASTLTLLFPAKGISSLGKLVGKATRLGKGVSNARRWATRVNEIQDANRLSKLQIAINNPKNIARANAATELVAEGMLMRTMENYQEARDTHIQMYQDASDKLNSMSNDEYNAWVEKNKNAFDKDLDIKDRDKVAKAIAKKAADRTFTMDFSNAIFDIIQLHGLKNIGKGVKAASGRIVDEAQQTSLNAASQFAKGGAKAATEAVKEVAKKPLYKRFGRGVLDFAKYNTKTALEESTEGIEEAVNYIAQQEGLTYGKALLEGTAEDYRATTGIGSYLTLGIPNIVSTWYNKQEQIHEYMKTPELQESAFWGVLGGVLFHNAGSALNRSKLAIYRKAQEKARAANSTTGESINDNEGWFNLFELPEDKAARVAIEKRIARLEQASSDLKNIENGIDIFGTRKEDGTLPQFDGDVETKKALARRQVEAQFRADIAMDAMNSGTYNQLLEYFKSNEVKEAMVAAGLSTKENIDSYTEETIKDLEAVKDVYARQSAHVLNQIAALNAAKDYDQTIPLEYAQIIAKRNVDRILNIKQLDRQIANIESLAAEQEAITRETNPDVLFDEARNSSQLYAFIDLYQRLTYESNEIDKAIKENGANYRLNKQKQRNDKQKQVILDRIKQTTLANNDAGLSAVFAAVKFSRSYRKDDTGKAYRDRAAFEEADAKILEEAKSLYGDTSTLGLSDETVIQSAKSILQNIDALVDKKGLANVNNALFSQYITIDQLKLQKDLIQSQISSTQTQIQDDIDYMHNEFNEGRAKMIELARKTIVKALEQYDDVLDDNYDNLINSIYKMYSQDKQEARRIAEQFMSNDNSNGKVTASEFLDALDIFNFSSRANSQLYDYIDNVIKAYLFNRNQTRAKDNLEQKPEQEPSSTENQKENTDTENQEANKSSTQAQQSNTQQANKEKRKVRLIINKGNGRVVAIKKSTRPDTISAEAIDNGDGTFTLDISSRAKAEQLKYIMGGLFEGDIDLLDTDAEWAISENPIIKPRGNGYVLKKKGVIKATKYNNIDEAEYQTFKNLVDSDTNFKDKLLNDPNSIRDVVLEVLDTTNEDKANSYIERYLEENKVDSSSPVEESDNTLTTTEGQEGTNNQETEASNNQESTQDSSNNVSADASSKSSNEVSNESSNTPNQEPQHSSTGELEPNSEVSFTTAPTTNNESENSNTPSSTNNKTNEDLDTIKRGIAQTFGKYIPDMRAKDINFDDIANKVEAELLANKDKVGLSEEEIKAEVAKQKQMLQEAHNKLMSLQSKLAQNGANLAFASKLEEADSTNFSLMFTNAVEAFMEEYKKIIVTPTVDGKQVVRLSDILRICNNVYPTSDNSVAKSMYNVIYNYLNSPIGQAKYLTIDLSYGNKVLEYITKTSEQQQQEVDKVFDNFRVNISSFIEAALESNESLRDAYFKALDSLKVGDELEMLVIDDKLVFKHGNVTIGSIPKPNVKGESFVQVNEGWVTDVKLDGKGNVISSLKPIFEDIFLSDTKVHKALRELLIKNALLDRNSATYKTDFDKLVKEFSDNIIIKQLVEQARKDKAKGGNNKIFTNDKSGIVEYNNLLNHLTKLWNYTQVGTNFDDKTRNEDAIRANLNRWFNMLYDTYNTVHNINDNLKVKITKLTEGQINRAVEGDDVNTIKDYNKLPLISDAVSSGLNYKLGIVSRNGDKIDIAGSNTQNVAGWSSSSTILTIFSKNEFPDYVKAIGVRLNDEAALKSNSIIRNLAIASMTNVEEAFQRFIDAKGFGNVNEIEDVIRSIIAINNDNDRIPLFRPVSGNFSIEDINAPGSPARGISIVYNDGKGNYRRFRIYTNSKYNAPFGFRDTKSDKDVYLGKSNSDTIAREAARAFMSFVKDVSNVNISRKGIQNDNTKSDITKGFITRKNGKLKVDITNKTGNSFNQEFDSYNDYITKGNLIRVNTKIGENGRNFTRRGTKQVANQNLYVSLPKAEKDNRTNTITQSATNADIASTSDATTFNKVRQTVETDKTSVGLSIFKDILGDEAYNQFKQISEEFDILSSILPTRILFDASMRDKQTGDKNSPIIVTRGNNPNAYYHRMVNGKRVTTRIPASEAIIVGNYFLNMASSNNLEKRKEAIRKLIHEQLHINLQADTLNRFRTLTAVNDIYEEFVKHLKEDLSKLDKNSKEYKLLKSIDFSNTGYKGERLIEEFMVESLTNKTLFNYLNSIKVENATDNKKADTLFTKIAKAIAKFFGWNIQDGSLYMKELNVLRDITGPKEGNRVDEYNNLKELSEDSNSDVEESKPDKESTPNNVDTSEGFDESSLDEDLGLDDLDLNNNDDAYAAAIEETNVDSDGFRQMTNLETFRNRLPNHLQAKFDYLQNQGLFEIKCK